MPKDSNRVADQIGEEFELPRRRVNQVNAGELSAAGAVALGIGSALIPNDAVQTRNCGWIAELARRFMALVKDARVASPAMH
jgi:2-keto-3-deoxy-6-phosphogluconate aldolase